MKLKKIFPQRFINISKHFPQSLLANIFFRSNSRKIKVIGVTGTDGKTTTVNMIYQILKKSGKRVSMISTINANVAGNLKDTGFHVTSPSPCVIQSLLKQATSNKDDYFVLEVTSHALDQYRVWGITFEVGVITNVTRDHFDYHKNFENYFLTKVSLLRQSKVSVINSEDENYLKMKRYARKAVSFGLSSNADINPENTKIILKIPGGFNKLNALAAAATCSVLGIDRKLIEKALSEFEGLSGRMEEFGDSKGFRVFIDFAHTPNALKLALDTLRQKTNNRLIAVFGAASQRDTGKRPLMGKIASLAADIVVLTSEDPRSEDPKKIIEEIASGCVEKVQGVDLFKIESRLDAIRFAINLAKKGDVIGIFGKGHEKSVNIKGIEHPWSEREVVRRFLNGEH